MPLGSVIIAMIKNSALIGFFGVVGDLSSDRRPAHLRRAAYAFVPVAIGISIGYLIMTVPLGAAPRPDRAAAGGGGPMSAADRPLRRARARASAGSP